MTEHKALDAVYRRNLEEEIIKYLAVKNQMDYREAMDVYYKSRLAAQIEEGQYGLDNLDYKYLAEDIMENEAELFEKIQKK
ncbi:MAG: hypothetical protein IJY09_03650 [Lachnospiraceae bacterium]|nr:hypothetical protein [Lachnospiraceae bacterium]